MKKFFFSLVLISLIVQCMAQNPIIRNLTPQSFKAGGVSIKIPVPDTSFVEVGYDNRVSMEILVPENNRLICAFVLNDDLPVLFKDGNDHTMSRYAMVEVPRRGENLDCETNDFKQVVDGAKESFGNAINSVTKESEDEFNRRMKSLDLADMQVKMDQPTQLGCFFSKQDIIGLGMLMGYETGGSIVKMGVTVILMRVKNRLLYVYLYAEYKNDNTITWLRKMGEKWGDQILKANKL
jgi:hypothetical protein